MSVRILSAGRGEGKTAYLQRYLEQATAAGRSIGGVTSPAIFEGDTRVGYDVVDLRSGRRRLLARRRGMLESDTVVGDYHFDDLALAWGSAAIIAAVREGLDVVAVDEVGPLEFRGGGWAAALTAALLEATIEQELVLTVRPSLAEDLPQRFPSGQWASATRVTTPWPSLSPT